MAGLPLAWAQLRTQKKRVAAAISGIVFAVVLMLVQLGFQDALMTSAGLHIQALDCDLILASPHYQYLLQAGGFAERRLYQAAGDPRVVSVAPIYLTGLPWTNPETRQQRMILVIGTLPRRGVFAHSDIDGSISKLKDPEAVLYDSLGRDDYGPVAEMFDRGIPVKAEVAHRRAVLAGLFGIGTTFGVDGTIIVSDDAFFRMMPYRNRGSVSLGLIKLKNAADAQTVRDEMERWLPQDVRLYTRAGFIQHEQQYWSKNTPVGFIFKLGVAMGLFVGVIIVYQILYTDVIDHLAEYATLKAIGYTDRYLASVVMMQGLILSALGFVPGALLSAAIYRIASAAAYIALGMTFGRIVLVYALTAGICLGAAALAIRPVRTVDPAEIL
jgi:putative ABC transport system permease protein